MDLDPAAISSPPPTLAASGTVLPHSDRSIQLLDQASHLTITTSSSRACRADASPVSYKLFARGPHPSCSRSRSRTTSACSSIASEGPLPLHRGQRRARSVTLEAQTASLISYDHGREERSMRVAAMVVQDCHRALPAEILPLLPVQSGPLADLPNEILLHILGYLDVRDLLLLSRTSHQFRTLALAPTLHRLRLRHARRAIPPLLNSPSRPSLADLISRRVFLTKTTVVSRKLARSLTAIRLSRRLAVRPPPAALVARAVLPREYVLGHVAPALVAKTRAVEKERVKDGLRRWVGSVWERRWREVVEERRRGEEESGVGRVWRLRRFWERIGRGNVEAR